MIKNIIFDLGGVILTDEDVGFLFDNEYLKSKININEEKLKEAWKKYWLEIREDRIDPRTFYDNLQEEVVGKSDPEITSKLIKEYERLTRPLGAYYLLPKLKQEYKLYALTNITSYGLKFKRDKFSLDKYFDLIVASAIEKISKPELKFFEILIERTGIKPDESLFIDNSEKNIAPAKNLGFKTIFFENKDQMIGDMGDFGIEI